MTTKKKPTSISKNTTGVGVSPQQAKKTEEGARQGAPSTNGQDFSRGLASVHREYVEGGEPIGTTPLPSSLKGAAKAASEVVQGHKASVLIDKLGERLAFERTGTRLYEMLMVKYDLRGSWDGGPTREQLQRFHDEELQHFHMLSEALEELGADPTAVTPGADVAAVEAQGVHHVIVDSRTTLDQALHAILVAELADHDGWEMLIDLTEAFGKKDLARRFQKALQEEDVHLQHVRSWLKAHAHMEAGTGRSRMAEQRPSP